MKNRKKKYSLYFRGLMPLVFLIATYACQPLSHPDITKEELLSHVGYLASDELEGRFPGTVGDSLAADYIRQEFRKNGLELIGEGGFQHIAVVTEVELGDNNSIVWNRRNLEVPADFVPLSLSESGVVRGPVVFAGYGISLNNEQLAYDDYSDLDVTGQLVMVLEGGPDVPDGEDDPFVGFLGERYKVLNALDKGAKAVIFVAGEKFDARDEIRFINKKEPSAGIPVIRMKRDPANSLLKKAGWTINQLEATYRDHPDRLGAIGESITLEVSIKSKEANTKNVIGLLKGSDYPNDSLIVIGAHFDHLGWGGQGTGTRVPDTTAIHPGADDNASGVAAIIELAGKMNGLKHAVNHSYLFIAFAGEELGLIGSKHYVEHPLLPLEKIRAMINLDMVGRLNEDRKIQVGGVGTAREFKTILDSTASGNFELALSNEGYGPSDHASFYGKDIPVLFISTGAHTDYHTPGDLTEKINGDGLQAVVQQVFDWMIILDAADHLSYQEAGPKQQASARSRFKVTLGIMPDVSGNSTNGLKVEFVTDGKPAQQAGMKKGDVIVAMEGLAVKNIYDYMTRLQTFEEGQTITVEVKRGEEMVVLLIQL